MDSDIESRAEQSPANSSPTTGAEPRRPTRVLVVEDDVKLGPLIVRALDRLGLKADLTDDGVQAVQMLGRQPDFSAVVFDIMLPGRDGIELCRHLRRTGWPGVIIVISSRGNSLDRARVRTAGADAFLPKPFRFSELAETLSAHMDSSAAQTASAP